MNYKFYMLKEDFKDGGIFYGLKRIVSYLFRPITNLMKRSRFLVNLRYGFLANLKQRLPFYQSNNRMIKLPQSELVQGVRKFWYSNTPGTFNLEGEKISRKDIFTYGGPNPKFTCPICQKSEWLSRVRQKNLFSSHSCSQTSQTKECEDLCQKQGDELWTHFHQNFDFSIGCDSNLPATKCLYLATPESWQRFLIKGCDQGSLIGWRKSAYAYQIDVVQSPFNINWADYDFLFMSNEGCNEKFPRPNIPIILYGHDFWLKNKGFQWVIDWLQPNVLLTSYPTQWQENFKLLARTKVIFFPFFDSLFFTRSNLNNKKLDLLVIGAETSDFVYKPRLSLDKQISQLSGRYKIEFSHSAGAGNVFRKGSVCRKDSRSGLPIRFLNKWSEYLGSAKYVIFGRVGDPAKQFLLAKYYETLGSGAIPIFPEVPDLKYLGIKAFEHYIPLSEVEGNNKRLAHYLDHYQDFRYIAENAVKWYKENSDKMLFNNFEDTIREITNYKYPKRLI